MKKITTAVMVLSLLITGCQKTNEPYLTASFSEETTTTSAVTTTVTTVQTEVSYTFSYMDHALFIGDRLSASLLANGCIPEENIAVYEGTAEAFAGEAADMAGEGFSYIYISLGDADINSGSDPEKYAADMVNAAKAIREKHPSATVVLLGDPPIKQEIEYKTIILADTEEEKTIKLDTDRQRCNKALYKAVEASGDLNIHFIDISVALAD
ncbi:MAG: hypothetical protein ILP19_04290, partial [Oscillospiraceae bacterium]|nr:hypothetical protein [Oscillospiraceae bacterium]